MTDGGAETGASKLDRKKRLSPTRVVHLAPKNLRESGELKFIEVFIRGEEIRGVAGAETVGEFGESEAS